MVRGNPQLDEPAQAAELAVMRWGAERGQSQASARLKGQQEIDDDHIVFSATSGGQRLSVTVAAKVFGINGTCHSIGAEPPDIEKRWLAGQVEVV